MIEEWRVWLNQARRFAEAAKYILDQSYYEIAYYLALHAGELALKSMLKKCGVFKKEDETHDMLKLLYKIERYNCLPPNILNELKRIVEGEVEGTGLSHVDVGPIEGRKIIDCEAGMTSQIRYPVGGKAPYEFITQVQAEEKVNLATRLICVICKYFEELQIL